MAPPGRSPQTPGPHPRPVEFGLEPLRQHDPDINENDIRRRWNQYTTVRAVLLEEDGRATDMLIRECLILAILCCLVIPIDRYKVPLDVYVCNTSPVSIAVYSGYPPPPSAHNSTRQPTSNPQTRGLSHGRVTNHPSSHSHCCPRTVVPFPL